MADKPDCLTVREVAEHYRTTEGTIRWWRHRGMGPRGVRFGRRVLFPRIEVERFDRELLTGDSQAGSRGGK